MLRGMHDQLWFLIVFALAIALPTFTSVLMAFVMLAARCGWGGW